MSEPLHGGRVHEVSRVLGLPPGAILDFSANLNPLGPPAGVLNLLNSVGPGLLSAYPDSESPRLRRALCERHGASPENLMLGGGGAALLFLALRALAPNRVLVPQPCFQEQSRAVAACGAEYVPWPMQDLRLDLACLIPEGVDAVIVTNPHNPTGQLLSKNALMAWAHRFPGVALVVDEAFADYCPEESLLPNLLERPRTVVLRSLTKFFAMPSLRVGHAFADVATVHRMRELQEGWPVGQLELLAAEAALGDKAYEARSLEAFQVDAPRFREGLASLGFRVLPSRGPFFLATRAGLQGTWLAERLRQEGLLIRTCAQWPGLDDRWVRLAVKGPSDQDRLLGALKVLLN